jgi:hypothetical protein
MPGLIPIVMLPALFIWVIIVGATANDAPKSLLDIAGVD